MKKFALLTILMVVFMSALPLHAQCSSAEAAALEAYDRSWGDMTRAGDRPGVDAILAPEYNSITASGLTNKKESLDGIVAAAAAAREHPARMVTTHDHYIIACTPNSATISHRNVNTPVAGGAVVYTRSVHFLEKRGGKYLVVSTMFLPVTDQNQIEFLEREWSDADVSGGSNWYQANLADDFRGISSRNGAVRTKQDELKDSATAMYTSGTLTDLRVDVRGDLAVATGLWTGSGVDKDKKAFTRAVRYTDTYMKRDGRWIAVASQGTTVLPN